LAFFFLGGDVATPLFAHVIYSIPFMVKPVMANLEILDWKTLEEAAESLGASDGISFAELSSPICA